MKENMKLPNCNSAYVPLSKLKEYLLSETHIVGRLKAKFYQSIGYNESNVNLLEEGLLSIARTELVKDVISSPYGKKYIIEGLLETPSKNNVKLLTVWIVETGENKPRFVTAYPAKIEKEGGRK